MFHERSGLNAMRSRLGDYLSRIGVVLRKCGSRHLGRCPAHEDRTPSFAMFGARLDFCGCYPCGFTGDIFRTSQWLGRSGSFREAVREVSAVLGMTATTTRHAIPARRPASPAPPPEPRTILWPGDVHTGTGGDLRALSLSRGLSMAGLSMARDAGVLRFCRVEGHACPVITDNARRAAEIRRMDRGTFRGGMKAYPLPGVDKSWLPGADALRGTRPDTSVLLVEGATDLLTAFHLLSGLRDAEERRRWVPAALLGAGCSRLDPACAELLRGRHVRLVPDGDGAGDRMADHWTKLLRDTAACTVDIARVPRGADLTDISSQLPPTELFA